MEAIGYLSYYGFSQPINFFKGSTVDLSKDDCDINILISDSGDLRHSLKSIMDILQKEGPERQNKINVRLIYFRYISMRKQKKIWLDICYSSQ